MSKMQFPNSLDLLCSNYGLKNTDKDSSLKLAHPEDFQNFKKNCLSAEVKITPSLMTYLVLH